MTRHDELRRGIKLHKQYLRNIKDGIDENQRSIQGMEVSKAYHENQIIKCLKELQTTEDSEIDLGTPCDK